MREAAATRVAAALVASEKDARVSDAMEEEARSGDPGTRAGDARGEGGAFTTPSRDAFRAVDPARSPANRLSTPRHRPLKTTRVCAICPTAKGDGPAGLLVHVEPEVDRGGVAPPPMGDFAGPFLPDKNGIKHTWAHQNCIMWCPEVYFDARLERLKHVEEAIKRGKQLKCSHCGRKGAPVGCTLPSCARTYHLKCAHAAGCRFNAERFTVMCPAHKSQKRTPAPVWSKTMRGDEALAEAPPSVSPRGKRVSGPDGGEGAAKRDATALAENADARPVDARTKTLLERLALGAGPAPNASGRPPARRNPNASADEIDAEIGYDRPPRGASKIERTRGVIRSVTAAGERVRREEEGLEDDETAFAAREKARFVKDKTKTACVTVGGSFGFGNDATLAAFGGFETLAGAESEIRILKELALLPLTYPEAFEKLGVAPGRGVLLHGPPGTGKTAAVRALLGAAARGPHPLAFFSRKGADALGKYMGEAERSLRVLFSEATRRAPSIIFFDEIDGLAPARDKGGGANGGEQDAIHGSVVATLLALMDGLDSRGRVTVIAATNRVDAVDPALRRPGRFDREVAFSLPGPEQRLAILRTHTARFDPKPKDSILRAVADKAEGAAGADLRAVAAAATLSAVRRRAPDLLRGDASRESLAAALEPFLPDPEGFAEKKALVERAAAAGHVGAILAARRHEALGERVAVFWSGNDAFFEGTVTAFDKAAFAHRVTYDDGEAQWLALWRENEVVRWAEEKTSAEARDGRRTDESGGTFSPLDPSRGEKATKSVFVSEALAAAEAKEAAAAAAATRLARALKAERPDAALVSCKKKFGVFAARGLAFPAETSDGVRSGHSGHRGGPPYAITCLCASCVSTGAPAFEPGRWEAHCGAGHTKKWRSTVRVELDDARVFAGASDDDDDDAKENENENERVVSENEKAFASASISSAVGVASCSTPVGRWLEMRETRGMSADAVAAAVRAERANLASPGPGDPTGLSRDERTSGPGVITGPFTFAHVPRHGTREDPDLESAEDQDTFPFDVAACRAEALALRDAFALSETRAARHGGGFGVTARDWARALATATGPCSRRSASGGASAVKAAPLPRRVAPALAPGCLAVARALRNARAPLDARAARALDACSSRVSRATDGNASFAAAYAEDVLTSAGLVEGRRGSPSRAEMEIEISAAAGSSAPADGVSSAELVSDLVAEHLEEDFETESCSLERLDAASSSLAEAESAAAAAAAAASVSGSGPDGARPRSARVLVHADGEQGQKTIVAAAMHALQGAPVASLSLASLIAEGEGDATRGVIKALREPLRRASRAPSVVHLASLETWALAGVDARAEFPEPPASSPRPFGVAPSSLWDAFEQTVFSAEAGFGEDGCLIVVAESEVSEASLPERVARFFDAKKGAGSTKKKVSYAGGGAECARATVGIEPPTAAARASLLARGAAAIVRHEVAPALAASAARAARARRAAEADARISVGETRKRAATKKRRADGRLADDAAREEEKKTRDASDESASAEWRRLERARAVESELRSRRAACVVLSEKARAARDAARRGVAATASSLLRSARFKPAFATKKVSKNAKNAFRAAAVAGAAGEFGAAAPFLAALRKASGKFGAFKGNVPDKWGAYPSRKNAHAPSDRGAAVAAATDHAASALGSDDARLLERRAAEAEAAAEAARREVRATQTTLETILRGSFSRATEAREGEEEGDASRSPRRPTTREPPETPAAPPATGPDAAGDAAGDAAAPLSATPSVKALAFAAEVAGAVRETGQNVTRDESVAGAAAALARALVEIFRKETKTESPSFGAVERALGAVSGLLTRAARAATETRALDLTLTGLIADERAEIERVCAEVRAEEDGFF